MCATRHLRKLCSGVTGVNGDACGHRFSWGSIPHRHPLSTTSQLSRSKRFEYHVANLRSVRDALDQIDRVGKDALRRTDVAATLTSTRLYALLLAAETECQLLRTIHEFRVREPDRTRIMQCNSQLGRWLEAIDVGFHYQFKVAYVKSLDAELAITQRARRDVLRSAVEEDLRPVIELRNDLAHGQWHYAFNDELDTINQNAMKVLRNEDLGSLHHKRAIMRALGNCVHDLLVSGPTFERDFDSHLEEVERQRKMLVSSDFEGYIEFLRRRHEKRKKYIPPNRPPATTAQP